MDLEYLKKVHNSYEIWLKKLNLPIIRIDADSIDLQSPKLLVDKFEQIFRLDFPKNRESQFSKHIDFTC